MKLTPAHTFKTPEIYGDFWFNSEPLAIHALQGQVVLLVFWDYTSAPSLRALSIVDEWHQRYAEMGLVVIGIHSPEFPFGRDPRRVERAIRELWINFPVTTDNSHGMWDAFRVQELPAIFIIDREKNIRSSFTSDTGFEQAERIIQSLLRDSGYHGELPTLSESVFRNISPESRFQHSTPMMLTGYLHGALGNIEGYSRELAADYVDPSMYLEGKFYAQGNWIAKRDSFELDQTTGEGYVIFRYAAGDVNAVMASVVEESTVRVLHDGAAVAKQYRGDDVVTDENGNTVMKINEPRLFNIIKSPEIGEHTLKLIPTSTGTALYSFSFDNGYLPSFHILRKNSFRNN